MDKWWIIGDLKCFGKMNNLIKIINVLSGEEVDIF